MAEVLVFVYGSLKQGFENHLLLSAACFEGPYATALGFELFRVGRYPALVRASHGLVHGELYRVDRELLERLDDFEGCPELYQRESIQLKDGRAAYAYLMPAERVAGCPRIPGSSWDERAD
jgi:gamma-glutamylcyclotransferase (GGCT)/AIG2-like uncharacterized protein YtfP